MPDDQNRNPDGTFKVGNKANPEGKNGQLKGWQRYGDRISKWLEKLNYEELRALAQNTTEFGKLSTIDAICVKHIVNALTGDDIRLERKEMLDRIEGTPKQTTEITGKDGGAIETADVTSIILKHVPSEVLESMKNESEQSENHD